MAESNSTTFDWRDSESILHDHIKKPWRNVEYPEDWRNLPEVPTKDEINRDYDPLRPDSRFGRDLKWNDYQREPEYPHAVLPHNIIDGPWPSKLDYVSAHYKILREDAIAPLRNAVMSYKLKPSMMEDQTTSIYTHVMIQGIQLSPMGAAFRVEFSNERAGKRIRWEQSKRLIQGSLVALSPQKDNFQSICKVAVVAARPIPGGLDQNPPQVDIFFAEDRDVVFDPAIEYVMIEAHDGYFEASRGMLEAMQKLMTEKFSLAQHLAHLDTEVSEPQYVTDQYFYDLAPLLLPEVDSQRVVDGDMTLEESLERVDILTHFPKIPESGMDSSQIRALENMLTKKISIIQGPPGTGKTFVSVGALKVLLANWQEDDPPIIVSAQTNHALDQLLNHVLKFEPEILRLGGRSSKENEEIRKRTVYELRNHAKARSSGGWGAKRFAENKVKNLVAIIQDLMYPLTRDIVDMRTLLKHSIVSQKHHDSLSDDDWDGENPGGDAFENWLPVDTLEYIPRTPPINPNLVLEDGEIQQEHLAALEAEASAGAAGALSREELEREALAGTWIDFARVRNGKSSGMEDREVKKLLASHQSLHTIRAARRGDVYRYWLKKLDVKIKKDLRTQLAKYRAAIDDLRLAKWSANISLINAIGIKLIGCTTTGLSKYRGLIAALHPRTILIEEAAETLEGTVIAGMVDSLQQLILVGDHKQLQANCNIASLGAAPYNMNVSMFERLVNNKIPYVMLNKQRRMIPEIRKLLCVEPNPFYQDLYDHESVKDVANRPPVPGMGGRNCYFFQHAWPEAVNADNSKYNFEEAEMVVGHYVHLTLNGVPAEKITVLTFYNGQRKTILQELKKHPALRMTSYFNCFTVDSFQGEENDVILLSLVRSNNWSSIGFLENKNRVVVALSRARCGFYLFGNALTLATPETNESSLGREPLWSPLIQHMASHKQFDINQGLPVTCANHKKTIHIHNAQDWALLAGGCREKCPSILDCGHPCPLNCHPFSHESIGCLAACPKQLPCGHGCSSTCGGGCRCDECQVRFTNEMEVVDMAMPDPDLPWLKEEPPSIAPDRNGRVGRGGRGGRGRGRGRETRDIRNEGVTSRPNTSSGSTIPRPVDVEASVKKWQDLAAAHSVVGPNVVVKADDQVPPPQYAFKERFAEVRVKKDGSRFKKRAVETILAPTNFVKAGKDEGEFPVLGKKTEKPAPISIPKKENTSVPAIQPEEEDLYSASPPRQSATKSITNIGSTVNGNSHTNLPSNANENSTTRFSVITDDLRSAFTRVEVTPSRIASSTVMGSNPASSPPRAVVGGGEEGNAVEELREAVRQLDVGMNGPGGVIGAGGANRRGGGRYSDDLIDLMF